MIPRLKATGNGVAGAPGSGRMGAAAGLVAIALVASSCGLIAAGEESAIVSAEPAEATIGSDSGGNGAVDNGSLADGAGNGGAADDQVVADPAASSTSSLGPDMVLQRYSVPYVPPIRLPDVSVLSETGSIVERELGDLAGGDSGLDVLGAECATDGGELVYQGSDDSGSFFDVEGDGSGSYELVHGDNGNVDITVNPDGSGSYDLVHGREGNISIRVNPDGSGTYDHVFGDNGNVHIEVRADGSGSYSRVHGDDGNVEVVINGDGSGYYRHVHGPNGNIDLTVNADGTGRYDHVFSEQGNIEIEAKADGSRFYQQVHGDNGNVEIKVNGDGSGTFEHVHSDDGNIDIAVDANGSGIYDHVFGPYGNVETTFDTEFGILDPNLLVVGPEPVFAVADRFPPLAKLGSLKPPCATIIRLDANVLFDFDSDQLRPEAAPVVGRVANALAANGKSLEVHGHTDAKGDDAYNQDLSERRAASFARALLDRGVTAEITTVGFGENRPVAPNENADGSDDPTGRQLNRRIEIVIPE